MLMLSWLAMVTAGEREHRERIFSHPAFLFVLVLFVGLVADQRHLGRVPRRGDRRVHPLPAERAASS